MAGTQGSVCSAAVTLENMRDRDFITFSEVGLYVEEED
jgi:hypothetical protein